MSFSASSNRILVKDSSNVVKLDTNERLLQIASASNLSDTIPNIPSNSGYFSKTRLVHLYGNICERLKEVAAGKDVFVFSLIEHVCSL